MNKFVKNISWILFPLLLSACGGGKGTAEEDLTTPISGNTALQLSAFDIPANVQGSSNTQVNFNVVAEADGLVSYRFDSIFPGFHFKPNSGVIALKSKAGQVVTQYLAPQNSGTYHYTLQIKDSQGLTTEHVFEVQVN